LQAFSMQTPKRCDAQMKPSVCKKGVVPEHIKKDN
jgi:hypothetical protein